MIIYKATNLINGKIYIGQTTGSLKKRIYGHKTSLKSHFQRVLKDISDEDFEWEVLCECDTTQELDEMEYHYIKQYDTLYPNGYNMRKGGDCGVTHDKTREHLSNKMKGNSNGKKTYKIITPTNDAVIIEDLKVYCKDNSLNYNTMIGIANGRKGHHHHRGYICRHIDDDSEMDASIRRNTSGYILTDPNGNSIEVLDLTNFCKDLPNLNRYGFLRLLQDKTRKKPHYKGWTIRRINETN